MQKRQAGQTPAQAVQDVRRLTHGSPSCSSAMHSWHTPAATQGALLLLLLLLLQGIRCSGTVLPPAAPGRVPQRHSTQL